MQVTMKTSIFLTLCLLPTVTIADSATTNIGVTQQILARARVDSIDLHLLPVLQEAFSEINEIIQNATNINATLPQPPSGINVSIIDVHTHIVPAWYRTLVPTTGGEATPEWDVFSYLQFMASERIAHAIFAFSSPGADAFPEDKARTIALARLMNEQAAVYTRLFPQKFNFMAVVPLPYTQEAIVEARYALDHLGASGIALLSNFEGTYLGDPSFRLFFQAVDNFGGSQIVFIHPNTPYLKFNGRLVEANPTVYQTGIIEFYFETARTLMDLTLTQTIHNFTNINYIIPHVGGAYPATIDRILKAVPAIYNSSLEIYKTRFWWDSAGPTYFHQAADLLGYGIPKSQLLFGSDFPYAPSIVQAGALAGIEASSLLTEADRMALFGGNAIALFRSKANI